MSTPDKVITLCTSCGAKLAVPATAAGKKIRCPKCQTIVAITAEMVTQPPEKMTPPAEVPQPAQRPEISLGGENTFAGAKQKKYAPESLGDEATFGGGCAAADDHFTDDMEIVDLAGRYKVEGVLGKGGMGEVQLATDKRLNRKVAIKRMLGDAVKSRTAVSRFLIEAKSIAALNHPNIVQIYDYGRDKDGPFLILEYVDGNSLLDKCHTAALSLELAVDLTCQLCDGLGKAHEAGIIHRDIKPANVLMTKDGTPKLTDFGLARVETGDTGHTMAGGVLGTLDFMPPEQRKDAALTDARSDLWSLAATLYQMVTGDPPRVIDLDAVPPQLRITLSQALKAKKEDRYQTAREFRDALKTALSAQAGPLFKAGDELGTGECAKCRTRNDSNRKFCSHCAAPLRISCLKCTESIPVWDAVCGQCGGKQSYLIQVRVAAYGTQREQAEQYRSDYQFESALELAEAVAAVKDERLAEHKAWADEFIADTEVQWQREKDSAQQHFAEAQKHRAAFDYPSAIHAIEQIPAVMRSGEIERYLAALQYSHSEAEELIESIADRVQRLDLDGLRPEVERAIDLRGDRVDLQKLRGQLHARESKLIAQRDEAYAKAAELLSVGDAMGGLDLLKSVQWKELRESDTVLQQRLQEIVDAEQELTDVVQRCQSDGVLEADEVIEMYLAANSYSKLNPRHAKIQEMHAQLAVRMQKQSLLAKVSADRFAPELLGQLPVSVLSNLPVAVLSNLPANVLKLPIHKNSIGMCFKLLPAGKFMMGSTASEQGRENNETQYKVTLTKPFYLGIHEVTQSQYKKVMRTNPSNFKGAHNPVESVSWDDAVAFCKRLSALPAEQAAGRVYRLPTEAEWEYACRAGTNTAYSYGESASVLHDYAWHTGNSGNTTHAVGEKRPNAWGLYDMHGNVGEWCDDWYGAYQNCPVIDPLGADSGSDRVSRGGSWRGTAGHCRSTRRSMSDPSDRSHHLGFRIALRIPQ